MGKTVIRAFEDIFLTLKLKYPEAIARSHLILEIQRVTGYGEAAITKWIPILARLGYIRPEYDRPNIYTLCYDLSSPGIFVNKEQAQLQLMEER